MRTTLFIFLFPLCLSAQVQMFFTSDSSAFITSPLDVDSLFYWFDASQGVFDSVGSVISNNQGVGEWKDLSGRGHHVLQTTDGARPQYQATGGPNNRPALYFDGSNDFLASAAHLWESDDLTIFLVMRFANATRNAVERIINHTNHATNYQFLVYGDVASQSYRYVWQAVSNGAAANSYFSRYNNWKSATYFLNTTTHYGNTAAELHINGSIITTTNTTTGSATGAIFDASSPLEIGAIGAGSTPIQFLQGYISEIVVYSRAVTTAEREAIENYLNFKYKLF